MSNSGQIALGVIGGIVGFVATGFSPMGAAYGFQLGLAVGTIVSPTQLPGTYGPRLTDNRTTTSQLGAPIIQLHGMDAVAGTVIWLGDIVEHSTTTDVGGKGGPEGSNTTFSYTQPIAIGLCEYLGPDAGVRRIWENGKLVYDRRPQLADEDDLTFAARISATDAYELTFTLYLGAEDQLPDPTIELKEGVGNVPAYRGLMSIVYTDRELRDDQARRHPNFKFEVFEDATGDCVPIIAYSNAVLYEWNDTGSATDPTNYANTHEYYPEFGGSGPYSNLTLALASADDGYGGSLVSDVLGYNIDGSSITIAPYTPMSGPAPDPVDYYLFFNRNPQPGILNESSGASLCDALLDKVPTWWSGNRDTGDIVDNNGHGYYGLGPPPDGNVDSITSCLTYDTYSIRDIFIRVRRFPGAPQPGPSVPGLPDEWTYDESQTYHVLSQLEDDGALNVTQYPLSPCLPITHPLFNDETFWTDAYDAAVLENSIPAGLVFGVDYPAQQGFAYIREGELCSVDPAPIAIARIVERIARRCSLTDEQIDVSDLEDRFVRGYEITRVMDGRSAIAPLRQVGFFDACESSGLIKFPTRGKASVRTLELEDLGAHAYDSEAPPSVTTRKQQDVELPRQLFVQYRDPDRDYENGEQASPTRLITDAVNDSYVDVAVAIDATTAAQIAEVIWADMWAQRWQHAIAVDCSQAELEPTDCIIVPVDGRLERMRIVSVDDSAVILRQFSLVRDDDGSYVSVAISDPPAIPPSTIIIYSATTLLLLDLPSLRVADNDAGIYAAARRTSAGLTWSGAQIYRSTDAGSTFPAIASFVNEATTGTLDAVFAAGDTTVWDDVTEIFVTLISGTLESRTDDDVLAGANSMAVGAHGRWEILQFGIAEQIDTDQWKLTHLLRGRRGTEHNMATQVAGDTWVLISGAGIIRLPLSNSQIGDDIIYKAVTFGASFATGTDITFASDGEALVPFSPVSIAGERDSSGDLIITWIRRDRLGSELPDGSDIAMSDPPESYEIDIVTDDSSATVVRTLTSSTQSVTYTATQEADDFGSSLPDSIIVRVYQMSAVVGRGTAGEATIEDMS